MPVGAVRAVGPLLRFRAATLRAGGRGAALVALGMLAALTVLVAWVPALLPGAAVSQPAAKALLLLPSGYLGVLAVSVVSAAASGGGRELLAAEHAVAFPVSATTDHLGALLLAPLNIAWLLQGWAVLGVTAYVVGPHHLLVAQLPGLVWLLTATATAQLVAWLVELVRRGPGGAVAVRATVGAVVVAAAVLVATGRLVPLLDHSPTVWVTIAALAGAQGGWAQWGLVIAVLALVALGAVAAGARVAGAVSRRPALAEHDGATTVHRARADPAGVLAACVRVDRAGVWRSLPLRRGLLVLAVLPGLVALAGDLEWRTVTILPGLVASGGALLFGVNAWCLDGRGALWRDSLPVAPGVAFLARAVVLTEVLLVATLTTLVLASLRAGTPSAPELAAVLCAAVVVSMQVVSACMSWSVHRPFSADMRSARATPAPPLAMVGYSTRLALATTLTGLVFSVLARLPQWQPSVLFLVPFLLFSAWRLVRTSHAWELAALRARVVVTVAG